MLAPQTTKGTAPNSPQLAQKTEPTKHLSFATAHTALTSRFLLREVLETYDTVGVGLVIVAGTTQMLHSNRVADEILALRDGLELTPERTLRLGRARGSTPQGLFDHLPDAKVCQTGEEERTALLSVPRPSGKRPLALLVRRSGVSEADSPLTLVFLIDPEHPMKGMENHVRQVFGLTPAETQLAMLLMQGRNLIECCQKMGVRRPTAASHLRQLFNKTQVRTQSQLVSTLYRRFGLLSSQTRREAAPSNASSLLKSKLNPDSFGNSFIGR